MIHQWTDVKDQWWHKASPCCKLKCLIVNNLWHCTNILLYTKILTIDWETKGGRYTNKKTWSRYFRGGSYCFRGSRYFRGVATFGIYLRPQKIDVNFGGGGEVLLSGRRYYRNFTVTFWISIFRKLKTLGPWRHSTNRLIFVLQGST